MAAFGPGNPNTAPSAGQNIAGSLSHFTLADANTDCSTDANLKNLVETIQLIATTVQIGTVAAGGFRFAVENNGTTAAAWEDHIQANALAGFSDATVVDFAY